MRRAFLALALLLSIATLRPALAEPVFVDGIVAVVGSDIITFSELDDAAVEAQSDPTFVLDPGQSMKRQVLERLIEDLLINQAAAREQIEVGPAEVDRAIEGWMRQNDITRDVLDRELQREGISWDEYHANMRKHLLQSRFIERVISQRVTVSDAQIKAYYAQEISNLKEEEVADVSIIFLPIPADALPEQQTAVVDAALALKKDIEAGAVSFEDAARDRSQHPSSADGGRLGTFKRGELFPALDALAFKKGAAGAISEPLVTPQGVFLARSAVSQVSDTLPLEQARPQIEALLYQQELERQLKLWLADARKTAHIQILAPDDRL